MKKRKIIVFGCQQIAVDFIKYLLTRRDIDIEIPLVLTYELPMDKTYGYKSVYDEARKNGLNVKNVGRISDALLNEIREIKPYAIFSVYYRKIFPKKILGIPEIGCINVHPSLLPDYRGPVPTAWAVMNGEKETGVTIHVMDRGIDTGDILVQRKCDIRDDETGFELYSKVMKLGAAALRENFYKILDKKIKPRKQVGAGSYYGKSPWRYIIDWQRKAEDIRNMIRVHSRPYNCAETLLFNRYMLINRASVFNSRPHVLQGPGYIVEVLKGKKLLVSCADGFLRLDEYEIFPKLTRKEESVYLKAGNRFD